MAQAILLVLLVMALLCAPGAVAQQVPTLRFDAPPSLRPVQARLESWNLATLSDIVRLVGLDEPGPPIRVVLAGDADPWAARVPAWVSGYAVSAQHLVVLFPARAPGWPHDTLEDVLRHEVTHVLIDRAAQGHPVPRWFHEGLAVAAERQWGAGDSVRLASAALLGARPGLAGIDQLFEGSQQSSTRGYVLSAAVVRDLRATYGPEFPAAVLREVASGRSFEASLIARTGRHPEQLGRDFWERQRSWTLWVPLLASSTVVWLGIIALGALARRRRRQRAAALRRQWDQDERDEQGP